MFIFTCILCNACYIMLYLHYYILNVTPLVLTPQTACYAAGIHDLDVMLNISSYLIKTICNWSNMYCLTRHVSSFTVKIKHSKLNPYSVSFYITCYWILITKLLLNKTCTIKIISVFFVKSKKLLSEKIKNKSAKKWNKHQSLFFGTNTLSQMGQRLPNAVIVYAALTSSRGMNLTTMWQNCFHTLLLTIPSCLMLVSWSIPKNLVVLLTPTGPLIQQDNAAWTNPIKFISGITWRSRWTLFASMNFDTCKVCMRSLIWSSVSMRR